MYQRKQQTKKELINTAEYSMINTSGNFPTNNNIDIFQVGRPSKTVGLVALILFVVTMAVGVVGNVLLSLTIATSASLRTPMNTFVLGIAFVDLLTSMVLLPLRVHVEKKLLSNEEIEPVLYEVELFVRTFTDLTRLFLMMSLSVERYQSIAKPLQVSKVQAKRRAVIMSVTTWTVSIMLSVVSLRYFCNTVLYHPCMDSKNSPLSNWGDLEAFVEMPISVFSILVIAISYGMIVVILRNQRKKMTGHIKQKINQVAPLHEDKKQESFANIKIKMDACDTIDQSKKSLLNVNPSVHHHTSLETTNDGRSDNKSKDNINKVTEFYSDRSIKDIEKEKAFGEDAAKKKTTEKEAVNKVEGKGEMTVKIEALDEEAAKVETVVEEEAKELNKTNSHITYALKNDDNLQINNICIQESNTCNEFPKTNTRVSSVNEEISGNDLKIGDYDSEMFSSNNRGLVSNIKSSVVDKSYAHTATENSRNISNDAHSDVEHRWLHIKKTTKISRGSKESRKLSQGVTDTFRVPNEHPKLSQDFIVAYVQSSDKEIMLDLTCGVKDYVESSTDPRVTKGSDGEAVYVQSLKTHVPNLELTDTEETKFATSKPSLLSDNTVVSYDIPGYVEDTKHKQILSDDMGSLEASKKSFSNKQLPTESSKAESTNMIQNKPVEREQTKKQLSNFISNQNLLSPFAWEAKSPHMEHSFNRNQLHRNKNKDRTKHAVPAEHQSTPTTTTSVNYVAEVTSLDTVRLSDKSELSKNHVNYISDTMPPVHSLKVDSHNIQEHTSQYFIQEEIPQNLIEEEIPQQIIQKEKPQKFNQDYIPRNIKQCMEPFGSLSTLRSDDSTNNNVPENYNISTNQNPFSSKQSETLHLSAKEATQNRSYHVQPDKDTNNVITLPHIYVTDSTDENSTNPHPAISLPISTADNFTSEQSNTQDLLLNGKTLDHLLSLDTNSQNCHLSLDDKTSASCTSWNIKSQESAEIDQAPANTNSINISGLTQTPDIPKSNEQIENKTVQVVEMDGTVHMQIINPSSSAPIEGAVCLMNPRNKEQGKRRVELKAALKVGLLVCCFVCLWMPLPISICIIRGSTRLLKSATTDVVTMFSVLATSTAAFDPILYGLLNRQIRSALQASVSKFRRKVFSNCAK